MTDAAGNGATNGRWGSGDSCLGALRSEIDAIHVYNGAPSMRVIAARTSHAISHTTVHAVLRCERLPTWGQLELVVENLGGETEKFKKLWVSARNEKMKIASRSGASSYGEAQQSPQPESNFVEEEDDEDTPPRTQVFADLMEELLDDIGTVGPGSQGAVPTGFTDLDRILNGLGRGKLIVVAGRPAIGKSNFALTVSRNASIRHNVPVLYMSFRLSKLEVSRRLVSAEARIPMHILQSGNLTDDDWSKLARRFGEISEIPFFINDDHAPSLVSVVNEARRIATDHGVGLLVVDSIDQLVDLGEADLARSKEVEISRTLKRLALELQIPIIAVDSMPHSPDDFKMLPKPPALEDLNGIAEDADIVIVIHRDDFYDPMSPRAGEADFVVVKHRDGVIDTVTAAAQLHLARFVDIATD